MISVMLPDWEKPDPWVEDWKRILDKIAPVLDDDELAILCRSVGVTYQRETCN
jgi:hypothetical protein